MWQFLYAKSKDRLELLPVDDGELWQLTVVDTVTTDMMGPARVDICRRSGSVCIRYVDRPVASEDRYELSWKSKRDRTCATSRWVELQHLRRTAVDGYSLQRRGKEHCYRSQRDSRLERAPVSWHSQQIKTDVSFKADESARNSLQRRVWHVEQMSDLYQWICPGTWRSILGRSGICISQQAYTGRFGNFREDQVGQRLSEKRGRERPTKIRTRLRRVRVCDRQEQHQSGARCVHLDVGWIKVSRSMFITHSYC